MRCTYQYPLTGGEIEPLICSDFDDGEITLIGGPRPQAREWLFLYDTPGSAQGVTWKIKAFNLLDGTVKVIAEEPGDHPMSWPGPLFDSDGIRVAWTHTAFSEDKGCVETILTLQDLATDDYRELKRTCADNTIMWTVVSLWDNRLVVERDLPDNQGRGNDLFLYDLDTDSWRQLTDNDQSSMLGIWESWIVWKAAPRYATGPSAVYNLESGALCVISEIYGPFDPLINEGWVYWRWLSRGRPLYLYNVETDQLVNIFATGENEGIGSVTVGHGSVAWVRDLDAEHTASEKLLEWRELPELHKE